MRVLVTSTPGRGHLGPLVPVASALRDAGHEVRWAIAAEACEAVAGLGFAVDPAGLDVARRRATVADRLPRIMALPPRQRRGHLFAGFFAAAAAPAMAADLRLVVDAFRPDLVVHEMAELGVVPLAVERGIPHVVVAFSGSPPAQAIPTIAGELAAWWSSLGLNLPPGAGLAGDRYLHPFPEGLHADPPWPFERLRPEPVEAPSSAEPPSWLVSMGTTRPAVYVTFGTERTAAAAPWPALLEVISHRDLDALVTTGAHAEVEAFGPLPGNVRVERYVPQAQVLGRVSVAVSHAGAGTMLGAASAGSPRSWCRSSPINGRTPMRSPQPVRRRSARRTSAPQRRWGRRSITCWPTTGAGPPPRPWPRSCASCPRRPISSRCWKPPPGPDLVVPLTRPTSPWARSSPAGAARGSAQVS